MASSTAAYSGLRWGELTALTVPQVDTAARVITVDRKVVEVAGHLYIEAPKEPQVPQDDLPALHARRLPARREARRPYRGRPRRAGSGHQPAGADLPLPGGKALAVLQLQPQRPQARLPHRRLARRQRQRPVDLAQSAARSLCTTALFMTQRRHGMNSQWPLQDFLELGALAGAVPCARLHARQVLWEWGFRLGENAELLVTELVSNAVKASRAMTQAFPVRLWLASARGTSHKMPQNGPYRAG